MHFTKTILGAFVSALYIAGGVRADDCTDGPFESFPAWGYPGRPAHFCHTKWKNGLVVTGMEVWATKWQIKGIQLSFSDGTRGPVQGSAEGDRHDRMDWDAGTPVTKLRLGNNRLHDALGYVELQVGGRTLRVTSDVKAGEQGDVKLGSGLLLGASGDGGAFLTQWTPLFMGANAGKAEIIDIKWDDDADTLKKKQQGLESVVQGGRYIRNSDPLNATNADQSWTFMGKQSMTTETSWSTIRETVFNMEHTWTVSATIGVPGVADFSASSSTTIGFKTTATDTKSFSSTGTAMVGSTQGSAGNNGLIKPGYAKYCTTTFWKGSYTGGYTTTTRITVNDRKFTLQERGTFTGISYTDGQSSCKTMLASEIPEGASNVSEAASTYDPNATLGKSSPSNKRAVKFTA